MNSVVYNTKIATMRTMVTVSILYFTFINYSPGDSFSSTNYMNSPLENAINFLHNIVCY